MWGNQGRRWLCPGAATEKLQVDGGNTVLTSSQQTRAARWGRAEWKGPAADSEVSSYRGMKMERAGPPLAWPSIAVQGVTSLTVTSAIVQFLPRSHKKPRDREVNVFFSLRNLSHSGEFLSFFNFFCNSP